jgi:hypothetical protein
MRRKATPSVAISIRIPLDLEARHRRLLERFDCSTPHLFALALSALEAQVASETPEVAAAA